MGEQHSARLAQEAFGDIPAAPCAFTLADSTLEPILWLSDWISYELRAWTAGRKFSSEFEQILSKISCCGFDELGRMGRSASPGAEVDYLFPDLPIQLRPVRDERLDPPA
jgi:hypothetical protein